MSVNNPFNAGGREGLSWRREEVLNTIFEVNTEVELPNPDDLLIGNDICVEMYGRTLFGAIVDIIKAAEVPSISKLLKYYRDIEEFNVIYCTRPAGFDRLIVETYPNRYSIIPIIEECLKKVKVVRRVVNSDS